MSINFENDMGLEAKSLIEELFNVTAIDNKTALLDRIENKFTQRKFGDIARAAKKPVTLEINNVGDRKAVGDVVYELRESGWVRLPIGTRNHE